MAFRAKPIVVDAFQYNGDMMFSNGEYYVPQWAVEAEEKGTLYYGKYNGVPGELFIKQGDIIEHVALDDYVVRTANGALGVCDPVTFEASFEPIEE